MNSPRINRQLELTQFVSNRAHPVWRRSKILVLEALSVSAFNVWILNCAIAGCVIAWLYHDPRFDASVSWWRHQATPTTPDISMFDMGDWWWLDLRNRGVMLLGLFLLASLFLFCVRTLFGTKAQRTTRTWLMLTSFVAIWLGIATSWQDITWLGKQNRLRDLLVEFEPVTDDLRRNWPSADGERPQLGPFMAYPVGEPRTLILLTMPELKSAKASYCVVERGEGVLRYELVGRERGDWLEWHPEGSRPNSFVSGLYEPYQIKKFQKLSKHWFLVRY